MVVASNPEHQLTTSKIPSCNFFFSHPPWELSTAVDPLDPHGRSLFGHAIFPHPKDSRNGYARKIPMPGQRGKISSGGGSPRWRVAQVSHILRLLASGSTRNISSLSPLDCAFPKTQPTKHKTNTTPNTTSHHNDPPPLHIRIYIRSR